MGSDSSIYFFTMHKCASTLFASYVLKNLRGFENLDYASQIYRGRELVKLHFQPTGHVYGPIRVSLPEDGVVYRKFVRQCLERDFLAGKRAVCFIRDPRDILISNYHSEGWTHDFSRNPEIRERQQELRRLVQSMTVDEYAKQQAPAMRVYLQRLLSVMELGQTVSLLRYEDMICRQEAFAKQIQAAMPVCDEVVAEMFRRSEPQGREDKTSHRRSGKTGQFLDVFSPATQRYLADALGDYLHPFGYPR